MAHYQQVGHLADILHHGFAEEVKVGLVHHQDRVRRRFGDLQQLLARNDRTSRVVRSRNQHQLGFFGNGRKKALERELERCIGLHGSQAARRHQRNAYVVHEEAWRPHQGLVVFFEKRHANSMDGLVDAVGQQHLFGLKPEVRGDDMLHGLALGILGKPAGGNGMHYFEHPGRRLEGVLVEVQAQRVPRRQRRMVFRHLLYRAPGSYRLY